MPPPFGLTPQGFNPMRLADVLAANTQAFQTALGNSIDLSPSSPLGQINGVLSAREALLWQGLDALNQQFDPDFATGQNQDDLYAINNVTRLPAVASTVTATVTGIPGTTIPGIDTSPTPFKASVAGSNHGVVFQATQTAVIPGGGSVNVPMSCAVTGPSAAPAGTLTVVETPLIPPVTVTNAADAAIGRNLESDTAFRVRRLQDLQRADAATNEGIRNTIINVPGVTFAGIIENDTDAVDANGLPPHSVEVFCTGGANQDIANAIFASKAAGIQTFGGITVPVTDSQGFVHNISFSRPTSVPIFFIVNVTRDADPADGQPFPPGGAQAIKNALVAFGASALLGQDVINARINQVIMESVSGIALLQTLQGTAPAPGTSNNIVITPTEVMSIQVANITVNVV